MLILISFILWANPLDYEPMDVPLPCLGAKYQNLWEDKKNKILQVDSNIKFFLHAEGLRDVIRRSHRFRTATVHRYMAFTNFHEGAHNTILEPKNDPTKQAHQAGFMIIDADVDTIVKEWPGEWHNPLAEPLLKRENN